MAKKEDLHITTAICDMKMLPFPDNSFDCIWSYHAISHTDTAGFYKILNELKRITKTDGEFYITLCSKESRSYSEMYFPRMDENTILKPLMDPKKIFRIFM